MNIFILSRSFPPLNVIGAVRPYELAKFLVSQGHNVTVFCSYQDSVITKNLDKNLDGMSIIPAPKNNVISALDAKKTSPVILKKLKGIIRNLSYPDHFKYAVDDYLHLVNKQIKLQGSPDIIFTTSPAFSLHIVGSLLKNLYPNIKWIADFRDLWATSEYRKTMRKKDKKYENKILKRADSIVVVTESMKKAMSDYIDNPARITVITNGADKRVRSQAQPKNRILYAGGLYGGYRDITPLFNALKSSNFDLSVDFYGSEEEVVSKYISKYPDLNIGFNASVSKSKINQLQDESLFLLVALGHHKFEKGVLPGKFFEYLESGRPIIALCDEDSELAQLINKYQVGVATRDEKKIRSYIETYLDTSPYHSYNTPTQLSRAYQFSKLHNDIIL